MTIPVIDADELYHSKGPWLTHKYIRREGDSPPYKYFYGEKTSTGQQVGEEKEVFLTERRKNKVTGGYTNHYRDTVSLDYRTGDYFEDANGNRVAKIHPYSEYGLEFYDTHHRSLGEVPLPELLNEFKKTGSDFMSRRVKKLESTYNYTNRAKGVLEPYNISEYAATPRDKRKAR